MATKTETSLTNLVINYLSESDYNSAVSDGTINENELYMTPTQATTDTKNTAGSTNTSSKIYLIGATSQATNPQTYSHDTAYVGTDGCLYSNSTKVSVDGHTHNYAGSSSAGGSATSAVKLDSSAGDSNTPVYFSSGKPVACTSLDLDTSGNAATATALSSSAGSATQPVYFSSGKPTVCSYTLGKSVPSDAVFTDTTYTSLKNPYSLTLQGNGTTLTNGTYDGSAAKTVNITVSSLGLTASTTELNYCSGVTSSIQTQLDGKASSNHTHSYLYNSTADKYIRFIKDGDYCYFRPNNDGTSFAVCGSSTNPWYKTWTERLEVTESRIVCLPTYSNTVSYATNMYCGSSGIYSRTTNTSSRTIKHDIKALEDDGIKAEKLYDVGIYQFKYNSDILTDESDCRYLRDLPGFVIEDLDEKYPVAVDKPSENVKEWSWNAQYIIPPMLKLIQDQKKKIDELETRLEVLEA